MSPEELQQFVLDSLSDFSLIQNAQIMELFDQVMEPGNFVTVAPTILKIRNSQNERLAALPVRINSIHQILSNIDLNSHLTQKECASLLLLKLLRCNHWDKVKFRYPGCQPKQQELNAFYKVKERIAKLLSNSKQKEIVITLGFHTFKIDNIALVDGHHKADMVLLLNSVRQVFISHKYLYEKRRIASFRQYSGISSNSLNVYSDSPEVSDFKDAVINKLGPADGLYTLPKGTCFSRKVKDKNVMMHALFGKNFRTQVLGKDNVHCILQGDILLEEKYDGVYELRSSGRLLVHPKINRSCVKFLQNYERYYLAMRSKMHNQFVKGTRFLIFPHNEVIKNSICI